MDVYSKPLNWMGQESKSRIWCCRNICWQKCSGDSSPNILFENSGDFYDLHRLVQWCQNFKKTSEIRVAYVIFYLNRHQIRILGYTWCVQKRIWILRWLRVCFLLNHVKSMRKIRSYQNFCYPNEIRIVQRSPHWTPWPPRRIRSLPWKHEKVWALQPSRAWCD